MNSSLNFWVLPLPSAVRVTSDRFPSLSRITASVGLASGCNRPIAMASGFPSSGIMVGNGRCPFSSICVTPICRSSSLNRKMSGLPSPFQSPTAMSLTPVNVENSFGASRVPSGFWR